MEKATYFYLLRRGYFGGGTSSFFGQFGTPAAAYSLRDLGQGAIAPVINVRRSIDDATRDFTAAEITNGTLAAWVGAGNDGFVTTWYDQAGSNDATQATAANQPLIVDAGAVILENGLPAIKFDGVDDRFTTSAFGSTLTQPNTSLIVNNAPNDTSDNTLIDGIDASNRHLLIANPNNYTLNAGTFVNAGTNSDTQSLLYTLWDGASSEFATDGGSVSIINAGTQSLTGLNIGTNFGGSNANDNTIQEIILYNSDKSSDRTAIETNINDHYTIY